MTELSLRVKGFNPASEAFQKDSEEMQQQHMDRTLMLIHKIDGAQKRITRTFFRLGMLMMELREHLNNPQIDNTKIFSNFCYVINDCEEQTGESLFLTIMNQMFGFKKSAVYNYIKVYSRFGTDARFEEYTISQLREMATLEDDVIDEYLEEEKITVDTSVRDIIALKKSLKLQKKSIEPEEKEEEFIDAESEFVEDHEENDADDEIEKMRLENLRLREALEEAKEDITHFLVEEKKKKDIEKEADSNFLMKEVSKYASDLRDHYNICLKPKVLDLERIINASPKNTMAKGQLKMLKDIMASYEHYFSDVIT